MMPLKQSTAIDVRMGPFVDVGDGFTPETGVTIAASDEAEILKANGAATVTMAGVFAAVTGCGGWYDYTLSTGDTDTVGELVIVMQDLSVYLPVFMRFFVVEEAVYDAMYGAAAAGPLQPTVAGRTLDVTAAGEAGLDLDNTVGTLVAAQFGADFLTAAKIADGAFVGANFAAGAFDAVWSVAARILTASTNFNDLSAAEVQAEVDAALVTIHLDHLFAANYDPAVKPGVATALLNELVESDAGVSRFTTNALEQAWQAATRILTANTNFNDPTLAAIADAVWDEDIEAAHGTDATAGLLLRALGAAISNRSNNATLDALLGVADTAGVDLVIRWPSSCSSSRQCPRPSANCSNCSIWATATKRSRRARCIKSRTMRAWSSPSRRWLTQPARSRDLKW